MTSAFQKLATKEAARLSGNTTDHGPDGPDGSSDIEGDGSKKKKQPNMTRLLKTRLQKLVDKVDSKCVSLEYIV